MPTVNAVLNPTGLGCKSKPPVVIWFEVVVGVDTIILTPSSTVTTTNQDQEIEIQESATHGEKYIFDIQLTPESGELDSYQVTSCNAAVAEVQNGNEVVYVSNGICDIDIEVTNTIGISITRRITLEFSESTSTVTTYTTGGVAGSVRKEATYYVDSGLEGKNAASALNIYSTQDHNTPTYVRNTSCWAYPYRNVMTCISPWNSHNSHRRAGTLITPRHIIFAAHYQIANGSTIRFIDPDNNVVERTMTHRVSHPDYSPYYPDLTVGILDSDVDADILPCKFLPDNWQNYLPTNIEKIPALTLDQEEKALVTDGFSISTTYTSFRVPTDSKRLEFYESKIVGDSGNPAFLIIDNELVLLTVWTFGGAGSGTSITYFKDDINSMIQSCDALASVSTGYTLTEIDLSSYNDYSA